MLGFISFSPTYRFWYGHVVDRKCILKRVGTKTVPTLPTGHGHAVTSPLSASLRILQFRFGRTVGWAEPAKPTAVLYLLGNAVLVPNLPNFLPPLVDVYDAGL